MKQRVFVIVLDSLGIGGAVDAADFGDAGSDTLGAIRSHPDFSCLRMRTLYPDVDGCDGFFFAVLKKLTKDE